MAAAALETDTTVPDRPNGFSWLPSGGARDTGTQPTLYEHPLIVAGTQTADPLATSNRIGVLAPRGDRPTVATDNPKRTILPAPRPKMQTQAYFAALRKPFLIAIRGELERAGKLAEASDREPYIRAAREAVERLWQYTDARDDAAGEYFAMLERGLDLEQLTSSKVRSLIHIIDAVSERRLDPESRRQVRRELIQNSAFPFPTLTLEQTLALESEDAEGSEEEPA